MLCLVGGLFILGNAVIAENQERTAVIEDTAGVTTEVRELEISLDCSRYRLDWTSGNGLAVQSEVLQMGIPLQSLISVTQTGETVVVSYLWNGKQLTAEGSLISEDMNGKSAFGDFQMKTDRIKTLQFKDPPLQTPKEDQTEPLINATLILADGSSMPVTGLLRFVCYYSTEGYIVGGSDRSEASPDIPFMRGESKATVKMEDLARVDFDPNGTVQVALKSGVTGSGQLSSGGDGIDGFCGIGEKGHFFIDLKLVKAIDFSDGKSLSK